MTSMKTAFFGGDMHEYHIADLLTIVTGEMTEGGCVGFHVHGDSVGW